MVRRHADDAIVIIRTCADYRARQSSAYVQAGLELTRCVDESVAELSREGQCNNARVAGLYARNSQDIYELGGNSLTAV